MEQSDKKQKHFFDKETFLLLGGGGMVGQQIAHEIARELNPQKIVICAYSQGEVDRAVEGLRKDFPGVGIVGVAGDVFVRKDWNPMSDEDESVRRNNPDKPIRRNELLGDEDYREDLYKDLFHAREAAYDTSELVRLIIKHEPDVIIDSINTATAFSYQDIYTASHLAKEEFDKLETAARERRGYEGDTGLDELISSVGTALETVLISQSIPQLVRHVLLLNDAMKKVNTRLYLKVGTTGTGGMGLNIPYTHSEDAPSSTLMEKTAVAFAHTGLMYLMARTLGGPAIKEFKPAAMIGYADIKYDKLMVNPKGKIGEPGKPVKLYDSQEEALSEDGDLRLHPLQGGDDGYKVLGELQLAVVNTGENGLFTKGEFQAITYMRQMEFITPEEIARQVVLEVKGSNTGYDVIAAIDGASMNPTYRAGYLRNFAIEALEKLESDNKTPSVALGDLGPPELGKLLWEAYLLHAVYRKRGNKDENELSKILAKSASDVADEVSAYVQSEEQQQLRSTIVSVGFPILTSDGKSLIRGPYIRIPEEKNKDTATFKQELMKEWANKGWVDLRAANMERWQRRFEKMRCEAGDINVRGSAAFTREAYLSDWIKIGAVVGWIFNNEEEFGYRIK